MKTLGVIAASFILGTNLLGDQQALGALNQKTDGEYVTLSGKVTSVSANAFQLKVGTEKILVEMDDYDWDSDGYKLVVDDQVIVLGRVDHDFLEKKKVEAGSVYVKSLDTYFYASSADEEGSPHIFLGYASLAELPENAVVDLQGTVTKINQEEKKFALNTGFREVTVDTSDLKFDPLDNAGFTQIDRLDRVRVSGLVDDDFFDGKEVEANFLTEI